MTCQCSRHLGNPKGTGWALEVPAASPGLCQLTVPQDIPHRGLAHFLWYEAFQVGRFIRGVEVTRAGCHLAALCSVSSKLRIRGRTLLTQDTSCLRFTITRLFICSFIHSVFAGQLLAACNAGDLGSIPGSGRSPREETGNPLQYSCLENPMDRGSWGSAVHGLQRVGHD